jgi:4'-phosphopantetheinyl transferase EntD
MIHTLFGTHVVTVSATDSMWNASLHPEEQCFVRYAVPERRRHFAAGRACAREALKRFGIENFPLRVGTAHEPLWPSGIVGSLSHCSGYCGVAVSRRRATLALGLDVDSAAPLMPRLRRIVCSQTEQEWIDRHPRPRYSDWAKIIFSAKESVYKCYFSLTGRRLNFHQVEIRLVPTRQQFVADLTSDSSGRQIRAYILHGSFSHSATHIFTGVEIPRAANHGMRDNLQV